MVSQKLRTAATLSGVGLSTKSTETPETFLKPSTDVTFNFAFYEIVDPHTRQKAGGCLNG